MKTESNNYLSKWHVGPHWHFREFQCTSKMLKCYENLMTGQKDLKPMLRLGCPISCKEPVKCTMIVHLSTIILLTNSNISMNSLYIMFAVNGQPVGKAMKESKHNLVHRFQPPIDKPTDNDIEKAVKELLKNTLQYQPDDRPTMKQVMDQLSQLKEQIERIGDFEVVVNDKHRLWGYKHEQWQEIAYLGHHVTTQQPVTAVRRHYRDKVCRALGSSPVKMNILFWTVLLLHMKT